jgi:hypothetical protein
MSYQLTNPRGTIEAVIDDNCGLNKFYSIANSLSKDFKVSFLEKRDEFDSVDWFFNYKGHPLKLHYNIYNGVSISTANLKDNEAATDLALKLEKKYF